MEYQVKIMKSATFSFEAKNSGYLLPPLYLPAPSNGPIMYDVIPGRPWLDNMTYCYLEEV